MRKGTVHFQDILEDICNKDMKIYSWKEKEYLACKRKKKASKKIRQANENIHMFIACSL